MTRRSRVWPVFENAGVTGLLPPWNSSTSCVAAGRVRDALCSVASVCSDELQGKYIAHSTPVTGRGGVVCVGDLWMGGTHAALSRGCQVELKPDKGSSLVQIKHKGHTIDLRADRVKFVVLEVTQHKVKMLFDDRQKPVWFWRRRDQIFKICWSHVPVYSIDAPGPTIRSMRVPPGENGFLIEDVRVKPGFIRAINGSEQWNLHRASSALAERLMRSRVHRSSTW